MKKLTLLFALPALAGILMGCGGGGDHSGETSSSQTSQTSESSETSTSTSTSTLTSTSQQPSSTSPEGEKNQTYNFYIDYSHSDSPMYTLKWWAGVALGSVPAECQLTSADAPDEAYPTFLGWSKYSSAVDDPILWDFTKDASLNRVIDLYGIWVSE